MLASWGVNYILTLTLCCGGLESEAEQLDRHQSRQENLLN